MGFLGSVILRFRARRRGEAYMQPDWGGALLDSPGTQKVMAVLLFRAPRGGARSKNNPNVVEPCWIPKGLRK